MALRINDRPAPTASSRPSGLVRALTVATALCACMFSSLAQEVGWIESIEGSTAQVTMTRKGTMEKVRAYMPVQVGDVFRLEGAGSRLRLSLADGKSLTIGPGQSPYTVAASGGAPTVSRNLLKWVGGLLASNESESSTALTPMTTRGPGPEPLSVPYLSRRFFLLEGKRALYFSWAGGVAPFLLRIVRQQDGDVVYEQRDIASNRVVTAAFDLPRGDYVLEVTDASMHGYSDQLRAVGADTLPQMDVTDNALPKESALLVRASWLAVTASGSWVMESMQQLHALEATSSTAAAVLRRVEMGAALP